MKKIYIVIINYGNHKDTLECLNSLLKINKTKFKLNTIVVDNHPEKRIRIDENNFSKIGLKIIVSPRNTGFSGGMNLGIKEALGGKADYILIQNNDTYVKEDFLEKLFEFSEENENAGIVAPKIYFAKGYEFHKDRYKEAEQGKIIWYAGGKIDWENVVGRHIGVDEIDTGEFDNVSETELASGCSMLISSDVFKKIGLFDEKYFLYYEDADLCIRAKKAGFKIYYIPKSVVWHKNAGSAGGSGSELQDYYITRNRLLFGLKYAPMRSKIALIKEGIRFIISGRPMQKKGASDFFKNRFGKEK